MVEAVEVVVRHLGVEMLVTAIGLVKITSPTTQVTRAIMVTTQTISQEVVRTGRGAVGRAVQEGCQQESRGRE